MSKPNSDTRYSRFITGMANRLAIDFAEADALAGSLRRDPVTASADDPLDSLELLIAVSLNGQVRGSIQDDRFKKLKFLLRNRSPRAVNLANSWVDQQLTFDELLASI